MLENTIATLLAYLLGSLSSAIIICKVMGFPDPRTQGSNNPGATNVLRIGGKFPALLTLLGDMLKGTIPVLIAKWYGLDSLGLALVAFASFLGHVFPVFFQFQGGKGVATALGCLLGLSFYAGLSWIVIWVMVAIFFRYSSLAALIASLFAPFCIWYFTEDLTLTIAIAIISLFLIYRHRQNIEDLLAGKERKIGSK